MYLSYDIAFNVCDLCDALFHFAEWVGLKIHFQALLLSHNMINRG